MSINLFGEASKFCSLFAATSFDSQLRLKSKQIHGLLETKLLISGCLKNNWQVL